MFEQYNTRHTNTRSDDAGRPAGCLASTQSSNIRTRPAYHIRSLRAAGVHVETIVRQSVSGVTFHVMCANYTVVLCVQIVLFNYINTFRLRAIKASRLGTTQSTRPAVGNFHKLWSQKNMRVYTGRRWSELSVVYNKRIRRLVRLIIAAVARI